MKKLILAAASLAFASGVAVAQDRLESIESILGPVEAESIVTPAEAMNNSMMAVDTMSTSSISPDEGWRNPDAPVYGNYGATVTQRDLHR